MIDAPVDAIDLAACTVPTDAPEADGTLSWDPTTASGRSLARAPEAGREATG